MTLVERTRVGGERPSTPEHFRAIAASVEIDALRATPGLPIFRPADGLETAMAWTWIAGHTEGPAALSLTRQKVKALERPAGFRNEDVWRGAYAVRESEGDPRVVLVATGSEVSLALEAQAVLTRSGTVRPASRMAALSPATSSASISS